MNIPDILGMELDVVVDQLSSAGIKVEVNYIGAKDTSLSANGCQARIVRIDELKEDTVYLTVTYHN